MKRLLPLTLAAFMLIAPVQAEEQPEQPDSLIDILKEAADSASQKAEEAADYVTDQAGKAADYVTDQAGKTADYVTDQAGKAAGYVTDQAGKAAGYVTDQAGKAAGLVSDQTSSALKNAQQAAEAAYGTVSDAAEQFGAYVSDLTGKVSDTAQDAVDSLSGAANAVIDQAGNIKNMAVEKAGETAASVQQTVDLIRSEGARIASIVANGISALDLTDRNTRLAVEAGIRFALDKANSTGLFGTRLDSETMDVLDEVVTATVVNGWMYSNGYLSLSEYASIMSDLIIHEGLPVGVGFLADRLPIPGSKDLAVKATSYLIGSAMANGQDPDLLDEGKSSEADTKEIREINKQKSTNADESENVEATDSEKN